jgi:flagellar basal-body rod modification protein FlgD
MATVGTLFPTTTDAVTAAASSSAATQASSKSTTSANDPLANQATFIQLLVAQLKNQDPTQPVDGTTFVTQLAQFSDVEQNLGTRQDLDAISERYLGATTPPSASSSTGSDSSSTSSLGI